MINIVKPESLIKYTWKQTSGDEYISASAPYFSHESIKELFYCKNYFRDAMQTLGNPTTVYFEQWKILLHGLAKDIWIEVLNGGVQDDNGAAFDNDEDGFIKAMEQYILQFCPRTGSKTLQQRAVAKYKFKFKRGTKVAAHMTQFHTILKYTDRLPGDDYV